MGPQPELSASTPKTQPEGAVGPGSVPLPGCPVKPGLWPARGGQRCLPEHRAAEDAARPASRPGSTWTPPPPRAPRIPTWHFLPSDSCDLFRGLLSPQLCQLACMFQCTTEKSIFCGPKCPKFCCPEKKKKKGSCVSRPQLLKAMTINRINLDPINLENVLIPQA